MKSLPRIAVVVGSTRPGRISLDVAVWARAALGRQDGLDYQLVDLAEVALPFLDEPTPGASGRYQHEHTRRWSSTVSGFDGFLFVFPQYNWGYPGVLKSALDFLYREWQGKPATQFTWGMRGGARGAAQFHQVMLGLRMDPLDTRVEALYSEGETDDSGRLRDPETTFGPARPALNRIHQEFRAHLG